MMLFYVIAGAAFMLFLSRAQKADVDVRPLVAEHLDDGRCETVEFFVGSEQRNMCQSQPHAITSARQTFAILSSATVPTNRPSSR